MSRPVEFLCRVGLKRLPKVTVVRAVKGCSFMIHNRPLIRVVKGTNGVVYSVHIISQHECRFSRPMWGSYRCSKTSEVVLTGFRV